MKNKFNKTEYDRKYIKENYERIYILIDPALKEKFKEKTLKNNTKMQPELINFIKKYVEN